MHSQKFIFTVLIGIMGGLITAGVHAVQTESRVDEHEVKINSLTNKIDKISNDTAYIRGMMERKQGE